LPGSLSPTPMARRTAAPSVPLSPTCRAKAFQALVGMGFRESEAKRALTRVPHSVSSLEQVTRQALRELALQ
ncbi:MAG TPA: RuvA C-terminal domain-containing protein, partial [Polyangiaceae bacterium]|nr:RuvA C-terminal domain-containing protein [Polyangiaceae bacterium]